MCKVYGLYIADLYTVKYMLINGPDWDRIILLLVCLTPYPTKPHTRTHTRTHAHTHIYLYIFIIYIYFLFYFMYKLPINVLRSIHVNNILIVIHNNT